MYIEDGLRSSLELLLHPATSHSLWSWQHERVLQALMCQQKHTLALRYLHVMKPPLCTTSQAKLSLSVLLHNRCIVEAWALLRQHCNKLNMEELMKFLFDTCQELGLMKELLNLLLGMEEQECLERFLQNSGGFQNRELLMVHYLQQANYVPALQLNQTLKVNLAVHRYTIRRKGASGNATTKMWSVECRSRTVPRANSRRKPPATQHQEARKEQHQGGPQRRNGPNGSTELQTSAPSPEATRQSTSPNRARDATSTASQAARRQLNPKWIAKRPNNPHQAPHRESEMQVPSLYPPSPNLPEPFEYAAPSTSEEPVGKEEEPVEQEPDIEPSVESELPVKELVGHEPVADAAVYTHIIDEPKNREECEEESMETSGASGNATTKMWSVECRSRTVPRANSRRKPPATQHQEARKEQHQGGPQRRNGPNGSTELQTSAPSPEATRQSTSPNRARDATSTASQAAWRQLNPKWIAKRPNNPHQARSRGNGRCKPDARQGCTSTSGVKRPPPLSIVAKRSASENVMTRAAFINNVLSKIEEVWVGKNPTPESSPSKSHRESEMQVPSLHPPSLNLPEPFEYAAPSTSEEPVGKEEEPVEQEPDIEPSVESELPVKELVGHEPVADAAVYTHIIDEPKNREECEEESMETSGASGNATTKMWSVECRSRTVPRANSRRKPPATQHQEARKEQHQGGPQRRNGPNGSTELQTSAPSPEATRQSTSPNRARDATSTASQAARRQLNPKWIAKRPNNPHQARSRGNGRCKPDARQGCTSTSGVKRPPPLSIVAKRSASENVMTRAAFINNVLSKIEEVWVGKNPTPESSPSKSHRESEMQVPSLHPPSLNLPEPFVGTPINMLTKRVSRTFMQPFLHMQTHTQAFPKKMSASTPQSILRTSLRPTPVATPSASPGRSISPTLRHKERRITFIEDADSPEAPKGSVHWNNGIAFNREINTPKRSSPPPKANIEVWSEHSDLEEEDKNLRTHSTLLEEGDNLDVQSESGSSVQEIPAELSKQVLPTLVSRPSLGQEASFVSNQSDSTLEFHDAFLPEDFMETQKKRRAVDSFDHEVTVTLPSSDKDLSLVEIHEREELPSIASPEKELENLPSGSSISNTEESQSLELELPVNVENNLEKEVTNPSFRQPATLSLCVACLFQEYAAPSTSEEPVGTEEEPVEQEPDIEPSVESELPVKDHRESEMQVPSLHPPSLNLPEPFVGTPINMLTKRVSRGKEHSQIDIHIQEYAAPSTSEEPVGKEEEPVEQEPDIEPSVESELPVKELVGHEPVADAAVYTHIIDEPKNREECEEESMETSDLDAFVEQHLFGPDLSPPLTRTSIKETPEALVQSEPFCDVKEVQPVPENVADLKTQTSVTSSEPATSESRSVVTLNDSDELTSVKSEDESEDEGESGDENVEDSGSEVEIIEEVKGNGRSNHQSSPVLFLEEVPPHEQYLQEQADAVLSLVTPEEQLKVLDSDMPVGDGEMVMIGLAPADVDEEASYTELKPSTTLLVPVELAEEPQRHLTLQTLSSAPDEAPPEDCGNFTLVLDPDVEEVPNTLEYDLMPLHEQGQPKDNQLNSELGTLEQTDAPEDLEPEIEPVEEPKTVEEPADVHSDQMVEPTSTSESFLQETKELCSGDVLDSGPFEIQEESHTSAYVKVLELSPPENVLTSNELLENGNEAVLHANDNITKSSQVDLAEEEQMDSQVPSTQRRVTRSGKQLLDIPVPVTPRSTRKAHVEQLGNDVDQDIPSAKVSKPTSSAQKTPQKATPRKKSRRLRDTVYKEEEPISTDPSNDPQPQTRQSAIKARQTIVEVPLWYTSCTTQNRRDLARIVKTAQRIVGIQLPNLDTVYASHLFKRASNIIKDSTHPERLDEEVWEEIAPVVTEIIRAKRRTTKSVVPAATLNETQNVGVEESKLVGSEIQEPANKSTRRTQGRKVPEQNTSSVADSVTSTADLRKTRGRRKGTSVQNETEVAETLVPQMQTSEDAVNSHPKEDSGPVDDAVETEAVKLKKKRTTRTKAAPEPPPPVEISFLSPLASPAEPNARTEKSTDVKDTPLLKMNLRRKRMMDAIFPKPVTRRKKL
ncbi:uncharacterized protein [Misgurnus anguillicaudatus]|uniref:uncharacterized protein n=1 Tax=Misgurnus anguillicaudatus TaxID=75329 RepID=UPI003CCFADBF